MISFAPKGSPARKKREQRARRTPGGVQDFAVELGRRSSARLEGALGAAQARDRRRNSVTLGVSGGVNSLGLDGVNSSPRPSNLKGLRALCTRPPAIICNSGTVNLPKC